MKKSEIIKKITEYKLIPTLEAKEIGQVLRVGEILLEADLPILEITLRTSLGIEAIKKIKKEIPELVIGAGTVVSADDAREIVETDCDFVVTPGLDEEIVKSCQAKGKLIIPGVATPTEIQRAIRLGLKLLKFFPAEAGGGIRTLNAWNGPFGYYGIKFIPLGGVTEENFLDYLRCGNVAAVGGSFIIDRKAVEEGDYEGVKKKILKMLDYG